MLNSTILFSDLLPYSEPVIQGKRYAPPSANPRYRTRCIGRPARSQSYGGICFYRPRSSKQISVGNADRTECRYWPRTIGIGHVPPNGLSQALRDYEPCLQTTVRDCRSGFISEICRTDAHPL